MRRGVAVVAIILVAAVLVYWFQHSAKEGPPAPTGSSSNTPSSPANPVINSQSFTPAASNPPQAVTAPVPATIEPAVTNLAERAGAVPPPAPAPNLPPDVVLDKVSHAIHDYHAVFGGNPVGVNSEITSALNGNNPKGINFIDPQAGMRINANGELIDAWGTPFFFHQLSGKDMEIRSAGPDKKMWTVDDLVAR